MSYPAWSKCVFLLLVDRLNRLMRFQPPRDNWMSNGNVYINMCMFYVY